MTDSYSNSEIDLKIQNSELRVENALLEMSSKFDRLLNEVKEGFLQVKQSFTEADAKIDFIKQSLDAKIDTKIGLVEKDINWIKTFLTTAMVSLLITLVGVILPIAWSLWNNLIHSPG